MSKLAIVFVALSLLACKAEEVFVVENKVDLFAINEEKDLQKLFNNHKLKGSILIFNEDEKEYYTNNTKWSNTGYLPASTFKIPHSLIALEEAVIKNETDTLFWNGEQHFLDAWEQDLSFLDAFRLSCVPCYQSIAPQIGINKMNNYIQKFNFGEINVTPDNLDIFWLQGDARVTSFQQILFLKSLNSHSLPVSQRSQQIVEHMMLIDETPTYRLRGKTGWSIQNDVNNGWFVGWLESNENVYYFATNIESTNEFNMDDFAQARQKITIEAFQKLGILE